MFITIATVWFLAACILGLIVLPLVSVPALVSAIVYWSIPLVFMYLPICGLIDEVVED